MLDGGPASGTAPHQTRDLIGLRAFYDYSPNHYYEHTRPEWMAGRPTSEKFAEIRRWHVEQRGWRDIGYHWVVDRDGATAPGTA
jgi:hypothetical protein